MMENCFLRRMGLLTMLIIFVTTSYGHAQVVINEVHVKPSGGDLDQAFQSMYNSTPAFGSEFIEIYNTSSCESVDISCWTIGGMDGGTNGGAFSFPAGTVIPPLGFITLGGPNTPNVTFNLNLAANAARLWRSNASRWHLPNGDGWVALYDATGTAVDAVYWTFASNDPTKLNSDATFTTGALQRIAVCGGGGLATASLIPGIEYIPQASVTGQSYERTSDGGTTWALGAPTPNNCNGICATTASFDLNATIVQPTCGNNNGSISFAPSPSDTYFYTWPFPSNSTVSSQSNLSPGTYPVTLTNLAGCSIDTTIILTDIPCGNTCDPAGNLIIYSNYDGGILTINVDQNIPDLRIGICTYEPIQVNFSGPFVGNITQVIYAGMNSNQNNNNCGLGNFTTSVTGVPAGIVTISPPMNPPLVGYTPAHGNGSGPWGGAMLGVSGLCDTTVNAGGGNTPDEVVYYFLNATGGTLLYHQTQYACWVNETVNVSAGGNCCILPSVSNPCPTITLTTTFQQNVDCFGAATGQATVLASGGAGPYIYTWTPGNLNGATQNALEAGIYTITVEDANNCSGNATVTVTEPNALVVSEGIITPASCNANDGTASVVVNGGSGVYSYQWSPLGGNASSASDLAAGSYTVEVEDQNGCTESISIVVTTSNGPVVSVQSSTDVSCFGGNDGTATVTVTGGSTPYTYDWSPSGGNGAVAVGLQAGTYTITVTDNTGCVATTTVAINEPATIVLTETITDANCGASDGSIAISASGGTAPYNYSWSPSGGNTSTVNGLSAGIYTLTLTDANGCTETGTFQVNNVGTIPIIVSPISQTIILGESVQIQASGASAYSWNNGSSLTCDDCPSPVASPTTTTTYTVTGTDANGCTGSAQVTIFVEIECGDFFVPTVFSPNGEGPEVNNSLCIYGNCIAEIKYAVYNRWGEVLFSTEDPSECWDATYRGQPVQTGVYVYKVYAVLFDGTEIEESGNLTILK
jgi:gliding motility-associated-like protein